LKIKKSVTLELQGGQMVEAAVFRQAKQKRRKAGKQHSGHSTAS
jgi:ribosomal protein L14